MSTSNREVGDAGDVEESEVTYETPAESPIKRWVLLDGSRLLIAGVIAVGVFLSVVGLHLAAVFPVSNANAVVTLLGALVGGTLPFITIVLAINQLILSQELGWTTELRDRFEGMTDFRREVERLTEAAVSPASPADFLDSIVQATIDRADELPETLASEHSPCDRAELEQFSASLRAEGEAVSDALQNAEFGTFEALSAVLGHHQGDHLYAARTLRNGRTDEFATTEPLDDLIDLLESLAIARQTFKTLYIQHELALLSRLLLYAGFPTLVGGGLLMLTYPTIVELVGRLWVLLFVAATGITLVFLPFVILLSYSLRIATIASRTADFGPFVPRSS